MEGTGKRSRIDMSGWICACSYVAYELDCYVRAVFWSENICMGMENMRVYRRRVGLSVLREGDAEYRTLCKHVY